jgi:5,10-methylenetetrahydrofolate reductase
VLLQQKLANPNSLPLLFEVVPPLKTISPQKLALFLKEVAHLIQNYPLDALDIPDLISEKGIVRKNSSQERMPPRNLAQAIAKKISIPLIINRVTVFTPLKEQQQWLTETYKKYNLKTIILVGAPDSKSYPGPSVGQMAILVKKLNDLKLTSLTVGAITIPFRSHEVERMITKQRAGIGFFLSQIIFEAQTTKTLLQEYYLACQKTQLKPGRIFLSFSPVSCPADLNFLRSLRVFIPPQTEKRLLSNPKEITNISIKIISNIVQEIIEFRQNKKIKVPLGINIDYVTKNNLPAAKKLIASLTKDLAKLKRMCYRIQQ